MLISSWSPAQQSGTKLCVVSAGGLNAQCEGMEWGIGPQGPPAAGGGLGAAGVLLHLGSHRRLYQATGLRSF